MKNLLKKILAVAVIFLLGIISLFSPQPQTAERKEPASTYEIFVYSFKDTDHDGTGDLRGVTEKLDYIQDLGFEAIWLMPVMASPSYHKYDITDYMSIDPQYGTMEDFEQLAREAHVRGMKVIIDLVLNHTSSSHPWFLQAADYLRSHQEYNDEECRYLNYYNFSEVPQDGYASLDGTNWYYEARFWEGMPDLNLESEQVKQEIRAVMSFWLDKGADGFRLDAVTSYFTGEREKNIAFLHWVQETGKQLRQDCYFVGEGWDNLDVYASYYASGIDSMFDFAFAGPDGAIARTLRHEQSAESLGRVLEGEWQLFASYSETAVNAPFYSNHDMNRASSYYAWDETEKVKLGLGIHLMMSGNVFLYYGEETGMAGEGKDENRRTAMYWSDIPGELTDNPSGAQVYHPYGSLAQQQSDPSSIYSYVKQAMRIRNNNPVIVSGRNWVHNDLTNDNVLVWLKEDGIHEGCAIVINVSDSTQVLDLNNAEFHSMRNALYTGGQTAEMNGNILSLPPYSLVILGT